MEQILVCTLCDENSEKAAVNPATHRYLPATPVLSRYKAALAKIKVIKTIFNRLRKLSSRPYLFTETQ